MRARITVIKSAHYGFSQSQYEGDVAIEPKIGCQFLMYNTGFRTSPIEKIVENEDGSKTLHTQSGSEYKYEVLDG